ncbi:hypothetical protein LTR39_000786 [Cryomyces antarcticus]|nr:hypothetical protein LTR39_000786 [Cryomyces antarcticus]
MAASYMGAFFLIGLGVYYVDQWYIHPPAGLPWWASTGFASVGIGCVIFGTFLLIGPARLVNTITAVPVSGAASSPQLLLRIEAKKWMLFVRPAVMEVPAGELALPERMVKKVFPVAERSERELRLAAKANRDHRSIFTLPFRQLSKVMFEFFAASRKMFATRSEWVYLRVKGRGNWKIDRYGGWALDGGKALDRLTMVDPH